MSGMTRSTRRVSRNASRIAMRTVLATLSWPAATVSDRDGKTDLGLVQVGDVVNEGEHLPGVDEAECWIVTG